MVLKRTEIPVEDDSTGEGWIVLKRTELPVEHERAGEGWIVLIKFQTGLLK